MISQYKKARFHLKNSVFIDSGHTDRLVYSSDMPLINKKINQDQQLARKITKM